MKEKIELETIHFCFYRDKLGKRFWKAEHLENGCFSFSYLSERDALCDLINRDQRLHVGHGFKIIRFPEVKIVPVGYRFKRTGGTNPKQD